MKHLVKKTFNLFGLEINRLQPSSDPILQIVKAMHVVQTDIVLDVGANTGQFAMDIRKKGYDGKIVSFEPLKNAWKQLKYNAAKDINWEVHERVAIGDKNGLVDINISKNSVSSSILPMLEAHSEADSTSIYIGKEKSKIITLDVVIDDYLDNNSNCFIKLDTQGYEWQVLDGASNILKKANGILCEVSLVPLYEGQHLWMDVLSRLEKEGFLIWSIQKGFFNKFDGRTL